MDPRWTVVRRFALAGAAVPILDSEDQAMRPEWAAIVEYSVPDAGRTDPFEGWALALYGTDGQELEWLQFDTLEITLDQAAEMLGISRDSWEVCRIDLPEEGPVLLDQLPRSR